MVFTPSHYSRALHLNEAFGPCPDKRVRTAVAMAIDREAMSQLAFSGLWKPDYNANVDTEADWINRDAALPEFDRVGAEKLLDDAGYPRKDGGWRFSTEVVAQPLADCLAMLPVIVQQLRAVGIDARQKLSDQATYFATTFGGKWETSSYAPRFGPDPDAYREHFANTGARNYMHYSNKEVDELAAKAVTLPDPAARKPLYDRIQTLLVGDVAFVNLFNEQKTSLERPGWTGFPTDKDGYDTSMTWYGLFGVRPPER